MSKPLVVQSDHSILLDVHDDGADSARADIIAFSELVKSPEHLHTYKISALSLWNAASAGLTADEVLSRLENHSRFAIPQSVLYFIKETFRRFGSIVLLPFDEKNFLLQCRDEKTALFLERSKETAALIKPTGENLSFLVSTLNRGEIKLRLLALGYPVDDQIPLKEGNELHFSLRDTTRSGLPFAPRGYQEEAIDSFFGNDGPGTGYGTIVLPCGSGKTVVGLLAMTRKQTDTLILAPNVAAVHQWINEILDKTTLTENEVGEYSGEKKEIKPVTVCTYQVLTYREDKEGEFLHFSLFRNRNWGFVVYDEVHMLPAPIFRITSEIQSLSRMGLTATLIREDGKEGEVFSLVGPKRYDTPWSELEKAGFIATAVCHEIRVEMPEEMEIEYALATKRDKYRLASENPKKIPVVRTLLKNHEDDLILIIGQYIDQLKELQKEFGFPIITGTTANSKRDKLYQAFRTGEIKVLIVSKVANFAIDLPDASVAIQVSGSFGSRQEEAQRLGRILRPKQKESHFYSIITRYSVEEEFAQNRQKFLSEQGYAYIAENSEDI